MNEFLANVGDVVKVKDKTGRYNGVFLIYKIQENKYDSGKFLYSIFSFFPSGHQFFTSLCDLVKENRVKKL